MSSETWKQVSVYIASGYFDMEGERIELFERCLGELRQMCVQLRVQLHFVDMRMGLNEHQWWQLIERGGYMPILNEIDRCEPFFIGLYGERYGDPIQNYKFPRDPMWNKVRMTFPPGRSVLELETYWGALREPRRWKPLFYFRDPAFLESKKFKLEENQFCAAELQPPLVSRYPERKTDVSIGNTFKSENVESGRRMLDLKRIIIRTHGTDRVMMDYPCTYLGPVNQRAMVGDLQEFGDHVVANLFPMLQAMFPAADMAVDMLELERNYHKQFLDAQLEYRIVGRKQMVDDIIEFCIDPSEDGDRDYMSVPLILHGSPGAGCSCVLSNVIDLYRDRPDLRNDVLIYHFVTASPRSSNIRLVLRRLCETLCRTFNFNFIIPHDFPSLQLAFKLLLDQVHKTRGKRIVLILDGADQMDAEYHGDMLHWLPYRTYARVVVAMHTESPSYDAMYRRYNKSDRGLPNDLREMKVDKLPQQACREVLSERMFKAHKVLSVRQTNMLLEKQDGQNPLFLVLAALEIMAYGADNEELSTDSGLDDFIYQLKSSTSGLCRQTFMRWIKDFPVSVYGDMVQDVICLLACARHGLHEDELLDMCHIKDPRCSATSAITYPDVPLPRMMYAQLLVRMGSFMRDAPRWCLRSLQFQQYAMLRAVQKSYFPDSFPASSLWVKLYSFAMARDRAKKFSSAGTQSGVDLVRDSMKNVVCKNLEEKYHARLAKYFRDRELDKNVPRSSWAGRYPRALEELPYHLTQSRGWSRLEEVLLDLRFIEGKFRQEMGHDLLQDFVLAVQAKAPEAAKTGKWGEGQKKIQDVHRYIAQNFKRLSREASATFQLAGNSSDSSTLAKLAVRHWNDGWVRQPWMRYLNKPSELDPLILIMHGHTAPVTKVRFSTDGLRIISSGEDSTIRLWDAFSGEMMQVIEGHLLPVLTVSFIPGYGGGELRGKVSSSDWSVISGSRDKMMKVFDLSSGMEIRQFKGHVGRVLCCTVTTRMDYDPVTMDPIKRSLVATGSWDRSIKVWDLETKEILHDLGGSESTNTCENSMGHQGTVRDVCFSPDGSVLASGSDDETLRLWNMWNGDELKNFVGHDNAITSVDYARNGAYVLTASLDNTLKLWDVSEESGGPRSFFQKDTNSWLKMRKELVTFVGNQDGVKEGRLSADLKWVVSGGMDGTVRVFDATLNVAMSENRKRGVAVNVPPQIVLYGHAGMVRTVCISPDSWRVVSSGDDGTLRIWDLGGTGTPVKQGHLIACGGCSCGPYGELVATCGFDGTLKLWNGREGLYIRDITKRDVQYCNCVLSPDALRLATANEDGVMRVYDVERGEPVITQRQSFVRSRAVCYSHGQGFNIATGSDDGVVKFWNATTGELKCQLDAHMKPHEEGKPRKYNAVLGVAYHPSNIALATCSDDHTIKYWARKFASGMQIPVSLGTTEIEMPSEEELEEAKRTRLTEAKRREKLAEMTDEQRLARQRRKEKQMKHKVAQRQHAAADGMDPDEFSSDESDDSLLDDEDIMLIEKAVMEDDDNEIEQQYLSDEPQKWDLVSTLYGHSASVTSVVFSNIGDRCFSCSEDGTIRAWTAKIEESEAEIDIEDLPEELRGAARRKQKEKSQKKEAGFGAHCLGDKFNSCLVVINVRGGMLRRICVTCDDAFLFAASDGLGGWGDESEGGLVTVWDLRGYHRAGTFETHASVQSIACAGDAPYFVTAGDKDGNVYLMQYGCQQPHVPKDTRQVPPPIRPSGFCAIL